MPEQESRHRKGTEFPFLNLSRLVSSRALCVCVCMCVWISFSTSLSQGMWLWEECVS